MFDHSQSASEVPGSPISAEGNLLRLNIEACGTVVLCSGCQLEKGVTSMGMLVDFIDIEKMKAAVKQTKLLMRDRTIWKAMGRFRTFLDMQVIHDYLFDFVNSDNTRTSQLRNASYKERDSGLLIPCRVANRCTCNISAHSLTWSWISWGTTIAGKKS